MLDREENRDISEQGNSNEYNRQAKEYPVDKEMYEAPEMKEQSEAGTLNSKLVERSKKPKRLQQEAIAASAVISLASFAVIASSGLINVTMNGQINELTYQDNQLMYNITVEDVNEDNSLFFEVSEGSKVLMTYTIELENTSTYDGDLTGSFSLDELKLSERMEDKDKLSFDVHLCGDTGLVNRTYDSRVVEVEALVSEFTSIEYGCDCANSGCFLFQMYYQDDYGIITDFQASITDNQGVKKDCIFTGNKHDEQSIFVLDLAGGDAVFELSYKIDGELKTISESVKI